MKIKFLKNPNILIVLAAIALLAVIWAVFNTVKTEVIDINSNMLEESELTEELDEETTKVSKPPSYTPPSKPNSTSTPPPPDKTPWEQGPSDNTEPNVSPDPPPPDETPWGTGPSQ
ncbi:MAG: hypothetical protein U9M89_00985 [Patescibacteria group bacterium]|nr:hypothetical protein [Patescibacteria group bacterium]